VLGTNDAHIEGVEEYQYSYAAWFSRNREGSLFFKRALMQIMRV
jgi:hypothetical protein